MAGKDVRMEICSQLEAIRVRQGLTQAQLAELSGVGRSHIARIEHGVYDVGIDTVAALAEALGWSIRLERKRRHPDILD